MKWIKKALPHVCLMITPVIITFYILDIYNPSRTFFTRGELKGLLLVFAILSAIVSVLLTRSNRREE